MLPHFGHRNPLRRSSGATRDALVTLRRERGQMLAVSAMMLPILLAFLALVIDAGSFYAQRRQAQNAADAAATAAAYALRDGAGSAQAAAAALDYAAANGFDNNGASNTVTVNIPPLSGEHMGDPNFVEVTVDDEPATFFIHAVLQDAGGIQTRGVAGTTAGSGDLAALVLNETACRALDKTGSGDFTVTDGGVMVNSDCDPGLRVSGSGDFTADVINYYAPGGYDKSGSGTLSPTPQPAPSLILDPLTTWTPPDLDTVGISDDSGGTAAAPALRHIMGSGDVTLHPGVYYGGLKLSGSGNVTFLPGTYVFAGGGFENSGSGDRTGDDVMFYNTYDPEQPLGAGACGAIDLQGSGNKSFTALASGDWANMLWWQDPACSNTFKQTGSGNSGAGIFYLPNARLDLSGSGNLGAVQIVADTFDISVGGNQTITYWGYVDIGTPVVALVE